MTSTSRARALLEAFENGQIKRLEVHEVHPDLEKGERLNYLYFTLPVALNFQRSSPALWQSALNTFNDEETGFVFYPEKVVETNDEDVRAALVKHRLAVQPNKHTHIWTTICETLADDFDNGPRELIQRTDFDVLKLIDYVQMHKKGFPYLAGPKLSNYWPYILSLFTDVKFKNTEEISIIPDTHVIRSSVELSVVLPGASATEVATAWKALLKNSGIAPSQMHSALWHWSKSGFAFKLPR